jgi:hypothetical protein
MQIRNKVYAKRSTIFNPKAGLKLAKGREDASRKRN